MNTAVDSIWSTIVPGPSLADLMTSKNNATSPSITKISPKVRNSSASDGSTQSRKAEPAEKSGSMASAE